MMDYLENVESGSEGSEEVSELKFDLLISRACRPMDFEIIIQPSSPLAPNQNTEDTFFKGLPILCANFKLIAIIGNGYSGSVMKVEHRHDGKIYAIKYISLDGADKKTLQEIRDEAKHLSTLKHKNVVSYNFSWIDNMEEIPNSDENYINICSQRQWFCIQMEYCETTLEQLIHTDRFRETNNKLDYFYQLVEGLAYVHSKGFIHEDLHTRNILVNGEGCVKIADFGWSYPKCAVNDCTEGDMKDLGIILNEMFQGALQWTEAKGPMDNSSDELDDALNIFRWIQNNPRSERSPCANLLTYIQNTYRNKALIKTDM